MPLTLSDQFFAKIAGWEAMKQARALLAGDKVLSSNWSPPVLKGVVQEGTTSYRAGLVIKDDVNIDNLCTCRTSREWGTICAHSVAVGLHHLRGYDQVGILNTNAGLPGTASITGANAVRPDRTAVNKSFYTNYGEIRYKGLLVDLKKRFSHNFQGGIAYTLSKTENNSFNFVSTMQIPTQPGLSFGPDTQDRRQLVGQHQGVLATEGLGG